MIIYTPEYDVIQKLFISGDEDSPHVQIINEHGSVATATRESAMHYIIMLVAEIDSGEIVVIEDSDTDETPEDWGEETI